MAESNLKLKIEQGTGRLTGKPLCDSCSYVIKQNERVFCDYRDTVPVREAVFNCNVYRNANMPSLRDMQQIAWTLGTDKGGRQIGFKPPKKKDEDDLD